ncbi:hypothetical protein Rhopal_002452-T1 [Rhodotorula paludigena]|uniref:RRM Nup35-type domain-containing protein n=1 Tax=Rhodotorula paludigena TaxID=86838 RepID=A0AAV5GAN0_9BASI|nr:hypothetical protein Rhopal_002452-T1 [Rhodotorula paludigena]
MYAPPHLARSPRLETIHSRKQPVSFSPSSAFSPGGSSFSPSSSSSGPSAVPQHVPHGHGHHRSSSSITSLSSVVPPHVVPGATASPSTTNQTRVLLVSNFSPQLKTKDLQDLLAEWQDDHGGLKVKWRDDTSAWIVFGDATVAKRAFLSLVTSPPPALSPSTTHTYAPSIVPYTGPDVPQILQAVHNRPRSRSIAGGGGGGGGGHQRRTSTGSALGSGGGQALAQSLGLGAGGSPVSSVSGGGAGPGPDGGAARAAAGHNRTASWTRQSIDRRMAAAAAVSPSSPVDGGAGAESPVSPLAGNWRSGSPETPGGPGGIVAGEAPRRFGGGGGAAAAAAAGHGAAGVNGHRRTESRSGSDAVANAVAGLTINE